MKSQDVSENTMEAEWYYKHSSDDVQRGPVSKAQLRGLAANGDLTPETLLWKDGMREWKRAGEAKGLFPEQALRSQSTPPKARETEGVHVEQTAEIIGEPTAATVGKDVTYLAGKFIGQQSEAIKTSKLLLPAAYRALGKHVFETIAPDEGWQSTYDELRKLQHRIDALSKESDEGVAPKSIVEQAKWLATATGAVAQKQLLQKKAGTLFAMLGEWAFQETQLGASVLRDEIAQLLNRSESLGDELSDSKEQFKEQRTAAKQVVATAKKEAATATSDFIATAKQAKKLAELQTKATKIQNIDLAQAFVALGKSAYSDGSLRTEFASLFKKIDGEVSSSNEGPVEETSTPSSLKDKVLAKAAQVAEAGKQATRRVKAEMLYKDLGKAVFEKKIALPTAAEAIEKINSLLEAKSLLESQINEINQAAKGRWITPKRVVFAAVAVVLLIVASAYSVKERPVGNNEAVSSSGMTDETKIDVSQLKGFSAKALKVAQATNTSDGVFHRCKAGSRVDAVQAMMLLGSYSSYKQFYIRVQNFLHFISPHRPFELGEMLPERMLVRIEDFATVFGRPHVVPYFEIEAKRVVPYVAFIVDCTDGPITFSGSSYSKNEVVFARVYFGKYTGN